MPLQNDPNIYRGGAVVFNTTPVLNIYAQTLARKQAREEALDAYEMNRMNRMNEQGVRDIDRPGLDQKVLDMKMYYQANKDRIRRGGTPEAYNYEKMFRETLAGVSKSKQATAEDETFGKLRLERKKDDRSTPDEWFDIYTKHQQTPIWDESFQSLPLADFMELNAPKYDAAKHLRGYATDFKRSASSPRYEEVPGDKYGRNKYIDETFSPETFEAMRMRAHNDYDKDGGFAAEVKQDFASTVKKGQLEQQFIKIFKEPPQSMGDYAAAKIISQLQPTIPGKPKYEPLFAERQKLLQGYKQQNIATYQWYKAQDRANQDYFIEAIYEDNVAEASRNNGSFNASPTVRNKLGFAGKVPASDFKIGSDGYIEFNDGTGTIQRISPNTYKAQLRDEFTAKATEPQVKKAVEPTKKVEYTQITETNKGTIGVKNGKWYYIKTGKPVE